MGPEDFRTLVEYPEYEINSGGMVRNRHRHVILMWRPATTTGKACVQLKDPENHNRRIMVSVAHLVTSAFSDDEIAESSKQCIENWRKYDDSDETER